MTTSTKLCTYPGCQNPRHVAKSGSVYTRCYEHVLASGRASRTTHNPTLRAKPVTNAVGQKVQVLVVDWPKLEIYHVEAVITCVEPMPKTYGSLLKVIAEAAQGGGYVAQTQAFKPSDFEVEKVADES